MSRTHNCYVACSLLALAFGLGVAAGACAGGAGTGGSATAAADLGPLAPAADGKPFSAGIDGIELGMTTADVAAAWGEPLSDSHGRLRYGGRAGWQAIELASAQRDHGEVVYSMSLRPAEERGKDQALPELIERFGPPVTDAAEAAMIRGRTAVSLSESETLFRAGRYAYAVADWEDGEGRMRLAALQLVMHPRALLDVPRSDWEALRYPFPVSLPEAAREQLQALLHKEGPDDATAREFETLLGPPAWKHPASLDREAWRYIFWNSETDLELYFSAGVLNGYQTQGLD